MTYSVLVLLLASPLLYFKWKRAACIVYIVYLSVRTIIVPSVIYQINNKQMANLVSTPFQFFFLSFEMWLITTVFVPDHASLVMFAFGLYICTRNAYTILLLLAAATRKKDIIII